jgi:hypothetical protein
MLAASKTPSESMIALGYCYLLFKAFCTFVSIADTIVVFFTCIDDIGKTFCSATREVSSCPWISTVLGPPAAVEFLVEHC